jgi:C1A family cysteine protease
MLNRASAAAALLLLFSACATDAEPDGSATPFDDEFPVSEHDPLFDGAPANDSLPLEPRFKAVYPRQFSDLIATQSPVKSQGSRGVCSIFATAALMEHLYIKGNVLPNPDFSEQYLQWSTKSQLGSYRNTEGSNNDANLRAITRFGIVAENDWRYESQPWGPSNDAACVRGQESLPTRCYTNGEPPASALSATKYSLPTGRFVNNRSIKTELFEKKTAVAIGLTFFYQAWNHRASELPINDAAWRMGVVTYPNTVDEERSLAKRAGHAVLIVGWDDDLEVPTYDENGDPIVDASGNPVTEKGFWIFKNSWGTTSFGVSNPYGAGYGYLSMRYVAEHASAYTTNPPVVTIPSRSYSATPAAAIPDNAPAGITSVITISDAGSIGTLSLTTDITHSYRGDLRVTLTRGTQTITLHDRTGGSADDLKQTFPVTAFNGQSLAGTWTLTVVDTAAQDAGRLNGWTLTATTR